MAYQQSRFTSNFNLQYIVTGCNTTTMWWPDGSDPLRDTISNAYGNLLGRYGEYEGVEYWVNYWNNGGAEIYNYSVPNMIEDGAIGSGELEKVDTYGRHTNLSLGDCNPPGISLVIYNSGGANAGTTNIVLGSYVIFSWSTTNNPSITNIYLKSGPPGASAPGSVDRISGSSIYYPPAAGTYQYYITSTNPGGTTSSFTYPFGFIVESPPPPPPPPPGLYFVVYTSGGANAGTTNVVLGSYVIFSWYTTNGPTNDQIYLKSGPPGAYAPGSVVKDPSNDIGTLLYTPPAAGTYLFYLTATGPGGTSTSYNTPFGFIVESPPPPPTIDSFSASPSSITSGSSSILTWTTTNATSVTITNVSGTRNPDDSISVSPTTTTTYILTATGPGGTVTSNPITVTVTPPPPAISYLIVYKQDGSNAGYGNIPIGQYVMFTWQVTGNVTSASLNLLSGPPGASAPGNVAASGSSIYYPPVVGTYIYYISATGPGGTVSSYNTPFQFIVYNPVVYGCTDSAATNYNPNANTDNGSCVYPLPSANFDASPTYICPSGSSTLSWSTSNTTSVYITGIGYVGSSGSISVDPFSSTTYTLTASGRGGSTEKYQTVTVYQYANVTISSNRTTIVRGESVTLAWSTSGSASSAYFSPGLGSTNLSGSYTPTPTTTTTYTISVTGVCNNDSDQVTVTVLQPPTVSITVPPSLNYNQQSTISYSVTNIPTTLTLIPSYEYINGSVVYGTTVNLPTSDNYSGTFSSNIPYNIYGPRRVNYLLNGIGYGNLADAETASININIDETPNNVIIPDSDGVFKDEEVVTPDETVTSYKIQINDIDIPVEIKSNRPIQVDIDDQDNWTGVRQI